MPDKKTIAKTSASRPRAKADREPGNSRGPDRSHLKDEFLVAFKQSGFILTASATLGIDRNTVYAWLKSDPKFAEAFKMANEDVTETAELAAMRRAVNGVARLVISRGGPILDPRRAKEPNGPHYLTQQEYSDTLLERILEARNPAKYGRRNQVDVKIDLTVIAKQMTSEVASVIQKKVPDTCPHCKSNLDLTPGIVADLIEIGKKFGTPRS